MIERRFPRARHRIHQHKLLRTIAQIIAIPKPRIVSKPVGNNLRLVNSRRRKIAPAPRLRLRIGVE